MYVIWIMLAYLLLLIIRTAIGPSIWDRLLGMSLICSKIAIIVMVFASVNNISYLLDYSIIFSLLGFMCVLFISFFVSDRMRRRK